MLNIGRQRLWPLWLVFFLILIVPFVSLYRVGPLPSFYLENTSLAAVLLFGVMTWLMGRFNVRMPVATVVLAVWGVALMLQARLMGAVYVGFNDLAAWSLLILALAAWACRGWVLSLGQERVVAVWCAVLLMGALIQAIIVWLQFSGWAGEPWLKGVVAYRGVREVIGQMGQRNHLGHYLMWGVLAVVYLWSQKWLRLWLAWFALLLLAITLAVVNSRTIIVYLLALGLFLPVWRLYAGREANRIVALLGLALCLVLVCQFGVGYVLQWFTADYATAVARVENSRFGGSARAVEWYKAWKVFLNAPLFGHGWGSYALQGFLTNTFREGYSTHGLSVLFTHSHNLILQLLAETGISGLVLVLGGYIAAVWRFFRRPTTWESCILLAMMIVSLCHSMLEYPLWYVYFLTPFAILMSLSPADEADRLESRGGHYALAGGIGVALFVLAIGQGLLIRDYTQLVSLNRQQKEETTAQIMAKVQRLQDLRQRQYLLAYYTDMALAAKADASLPPPAWAQQAVLQSQYFRPYANAYKRGFFLERMGQHTEAAEWLEHIYRYYPNMLPFYLDKAAASSALSQPYHQAAKHCVAFHRIYPDSKPCAVK